MRVLLLGTLLAATAVPALAQNATQQLPATTTVLRSETAAERSALALPAGPIDDATFVTQAALNAGFSSEIARMAIERSSDVDVQNLARAVADSRAVETQRLAVLAGLLQQPMPELNGPLGQVARELAATGSDQFDLRYVNLQTEAVQQAIGLYGTAARVGEAPVLRSVALRDMPVLQTHQSAALELLRELTPPIEISAERDIRLEDFTAGSIDEPQPGRFMETRPGEFPSVLDDSAAPRSGFGRY